MVILIDAGEQAIEIGTDGLRVLIMDIENAFVVMMVDARVVH